MWPFNFNMIWLHENSHHLALIFFEITIALFVALPIVCYKLYWRRLHKSPNTNL